MENKKIGKKIYGISLIVVMMLSLAISIPMLEKEESGSWHLLTLSADDVDPGTGVDGIVNIMIIKDASIGDITGSPYYVAEADADVMAHGDTTNGWQDGEALEGDVPTGENYFIAVVVQFDYDKVYNTTTTSLDKTLCKAVLTSADLGYSSEEMLEGGDFFDTSGTDDTKLTFYLNPDDTLTTGETVDVTDLDIYYYA